MVAVVASTAAASILVAAAEDRTVITLSAGTVGVGALGAGVEAQAFAFVQSFVHTSQILWSLCYLSL